MVKMIPELSSRILSQSIELPQQVDLRKILNVVISDSSSRVSSSMNSVMIGSVVMNFVISFGMKKLLETIRVYQLIAFFVLFPINLPPISKLMLQAIFSFANFKIVPKETMSDILETIGLKG